ncbi:SKA complex subunit 1-like isoform X4 [Tachypleus tridentatus]|uniref:SKA complex subunit 1-like isoform X4 n=1 Tax=Tachypleus tridentatus TaxID=6853 RepID=UPI003FD339B3
MKVTMIGKKSMELENLAEYFLEKTEFLKKCLLLRNMDSSSMGVIQSIQEHIVQLKNLLVKMREEVDYIQKNLKNYEELQKKLQELDQRLDYCNQNIPQALVHQLSSLTRYMKGRLNCETVNRVIDGLNKALLAKYALLQTPRNQLEKGALKKYKDYKTQENKETQGLWFCIQEDLANYSNIQWDNVTRSAITILRHCGRIKEIRSPGGLVRFTVISHSPLNS